MNRCDECQHWDRDADTRGVPDLGRCRRAMQIWDATDWEEDATDPEGYPVRTPASKEARDTMVFVADGSDYSASLLTRNDFFCAHFTAKNPGLLEPPPRNWLRELIDHDKVARVEVEARRDTTRWKTGSYEVIAHLTGPTSEGADNVASWAPTIQQAAEFVLTGLLRS